MKPYSKDLRVKVLAAVDRGMLRKDVAQIFGVSEPTIRRYLRLRRQTGDVEPRPLPGPPAPKREALEERLPAQVRLNPDLTLSEHCELFEEESGVEGSSATMSRAFERLWGCRSKKSLPAAERDEEHRALWRKEARKVDPERFVFVDECG